MNWWNPLGQFVSGHVGWHHVTLPSQISILSGRKQSRANAQIYSRCYAIRFYQHFLWWKWTYSNNIDIWPVTIYICGEINDSLFNRLFSSGSYKNRRWVSRHISLTSSYQCKCIRLHSCSSFSTESLPHTTTARDISPQKVSKSTGASILARHSPPTFTGATS